MKKEHDSNTQDDTEAAKIRYTPVCFFCRHYDRSVKESDKHSCAAFPEGIPHEIWSGANDHSQSFIGDNGIQCEPRFK